MSRFLRTIGLVGALLGLVACTTDTSADDDPLTGDAVAQDVMAGDTGDTPVSDTADLADSDASPACTDASPCDDGDPCTIDDRCSDGACRGTETPCDDGRPCTDDQCDGFGGCLHPIAPDHCLINGVCWSGGDADPGESCRRCDPSLSTLAWTPRTNLAPCDDNNPCTYLDYCQHGSCRSGIPTSCSDGDPCTQDSCTPNAGCLHTPVSGLPCDDGNKCTTGDVCTGGHCLPTGAGCDDADPCTDDVCLSGAGCVHIAGDWSCSDGDACTADDHCVDGSCVSGDAVDCDDGNPCTQAQCDPAFGCWYSATDDLCCDGTLGVCDDGDACTADTCVPGGGCDHTPMTGGCDDGDACTTDDSCVAGVCSGVNQSCDDGEPCTADACDPAVGCFHLPAPGPCDDGIDCTTGDTCAGGSCAGSDAACVCDREFGPDTARITQLAIAPAGVGLDLTGDGQPDNALAALATFVNEPLAAQVAAGNPRFLLEVSPDLGAPDAVFLYTGQDAAGGAQVFNAALDDTCSPQLQLVDATLAAGPPTTLMAGGAGQVITLVLPVFGSEIALPIYDARVQLVLTDGSGVTSGVLAGAVPKTALAAAIETVPPNALPVPKETLVQLLDAVIQPDIQTNPPAAADAASVAFAFDAEVVTLLGVVP